MRAPLSWIREHVEIPAGHAPADVAERLTELGLKLESLEAAGSDLRGPLVLGRVLETVDEPQKNGKVIRWCQVDVGGANGTGEPQGIVCGAHNFEVGDLVVVVSPGRDPARGVRDHCPQDLRPRLGRDDLLGTRARPG